MKKKLRAEGNRRTALNRANRVDYVWIEAEDFENDDDECEIEEYWSNYYEED